MKRLNSIAVLFTAIVTVLTLLSAECNFSGSSGNEDTDHVITYLGFEGNVSEKGKPVEGTAFYRHHLDGAEIHEEREDFKVISDPHGDFRVQKDFILKKGDYELQVATGGWQSSVFTTKIDGESQIHILWTVGSAADPKKTQY